MFRIGDFSRIARVSARLLRYYEEIGLITPARVDRDTGYRFYSASQLPQLNRIMVLKEMGFSLEEIGPIMRDSISGAELRAMLALRRADAARAAEQELQRLRHIESRIAQIDAEGGLSFDDVVIRPEPARQVVSLRRVVPSFAQAIGLARELHEHVATRFRRNTLGALFGVAHAVEFELDRLDVEFGFVLDSAGAPPQLPAGSPLSIRELPAAQQLATCVRVGLPEHAHLVTARIGGFIEANGYELAGPSREVFLQPPKFDRMEESVIEMQFPIRALAG